MPTDSIRSVIEKEEHFLVTAIADLPEIDTAAVTGETRAVVAAGKGGWLRHAIAASNDDEPGATSFGALNWRSGQGALYMEARICISDITDNKFFVGFGDTIASSAETSFSATTDTVTIATMSDAIGILFDNDATTKALWCVAGATDVVTVGQVLSTEFNPVAATPLVLGVWLSADRKSARWYVNGREVWHVDGTAVLVAAANLVPGVWDYEQGTAYNDDIDYIYAKTTLSTVV